MKRMRYHTIPKKPEDVASLKELIEQQYMFGFTDEQVWQRLKFPYYILLMYKPYDAILEKAEHVSRLLEDGFSVNKVKELTGVNSRFVKLYHNIEDTRFLLEGMGEQAVKMYNKYKELAADNPRKFYNAINSREMARLHLNKDKRVERVRRTQEEIKVLRAIVDELAPDIVEEAIEKMRPEIRGEAVRRERSKQRRAAIKAEKKALQVANRYHRKWLCYGLPEGKYVRIKIDARFHEAVKEFLRMTHTKTAEAVVIAMIHYLDMHGTYVNEKGELIQKGGEAELKQAKLLASQYRKRVLNDKDPSSILFTEETNVASIEDDLDYLYM